MQRYCDAIEEIAARFLISTGSDKIGRKGAMLLCFAITILAIVLLTFSKGIVYVVCFWLLSFTYGGTATTMPSLTTDYLGSENAGLVCSLVMIGFGVASVGTSFLAKAVNTSMAFILAGVIAIVGILVTLALPKLGRQNNNSGLPARISGRKLFLRKNMIFSHRGYLTTIPCIVLLYKFRTS